MRSAEKAEQIDVLFGVETPIGPYREGEGEGRRKCAHCTV